MSFFETLYSDCSAGWLTLWTKADKRTHWFEAATYEKAEERARELAAKTDVYFGVGLRRERLNSGRGETKDVCCLPGFWLDVDVAGGAHAQSDLPGNTDQATGLLYSFPLKPSLLIHSGYGLHAYWLFTEPWELKGGAEQKEAQDLLSQFQATIREKAKTRGWKLDNTSDLARVLRVPGTLNHKQEPPREVKIIERSDLRYDPSDFEPYLLDPGFMVDDADSKDEIPAGDVSLITERCAFIQHCQDQAAKLTEPEWYAMIANLVKAQGGPAMVHEFSKPYHKYSKKETDEKIQHALRKGYPHTCAYIQAELGFGGCPKDGCGVAAPIALAVSNVARAKYHVQELSEMDPGDVFTPEVVGALAILKKEDPTYYAGLKQELRGRVNLNDLERAVNHRVAKTQKMRVVTQDEELPTLNEILPEAPLKEIRIPYAWTFNTNGIWQTKTTREGKVETICACSVPVILTKRLKNIDTGQEKVELSFYRDKKWNLIIADRSTVFSRQGLVSLTDRGLTVSSETAKHLIAFLDGLERENLSILPLKKSVSRMGWVGNQFLPGAAEGIELDVEEQQSGTIKIVNGYKPMGALGEWVENVGAVAREYPVARFLLGASFAAPMLRVLGERTFLVHAYGGTRGGKTAALKAAMSVWGNPDDIMGTFYATRVGLERLAGFFCDLPMGIDEQQVVGDRQAFVESLIYLIGGGQGKIRGSKGGGLQEVHRWNTIAITTGEQTITLDGTREGAKTRALEIYGKPIDDEKQAAMLHNATTRCHGTAGPAFIKKLIQCIAESPDEFHEQYKKLVEAFYDRYPDHVSAHLAYVAIISLADFYSGQWVFGLSEEDAGEQSKELAETILSTLERQDELDESIRAYEYLMAWYRSNRAYFDTTERQCYGRVDDIKGILYVYPPVFDEALAKGGFSPRRVLRDWNQQNLIEVEQRTGEDKVRFRVRKWDPEARTMDLFVGVKLPDGSDG